VRGDYSPSRASSGTLCVGGELRKDLPLEVIKGGAEGWVNRFRESKKGGVWQNSSGPPVDIPETKTRERGRPPGDNSKRVGEISSTECENFMEQGDWRGGYTGSQRQPLKKGFKEGPRQVK